jgi:hypothetical protein
MRRGALAAAVLGTGLLTTVLAPASPRQVAAPSMQQLLDQAGHDLPFVPQLASVSCPVERGPVKEGADADRNRVSSTLVNTSVAALRTRPKPSTYPKNNRVTTTEFHIWAVTAYLTQYKQESDGDIHLVIKDSAGRSMIAELPYGSCVPSTSRWRTAILSARSTFGHTYAVSTSWHYVHRLVDLHGVGYMDPLHGQTGVAPNGVELHPVIYVHFH